MLVLVQADDPRRGLASPEEAAARGNWSEPQFLTNLTDLNSATRHTQFADFHGHGWAFRAVFKKDRQGNLLDWKGDKVSQYTNENLREAMGEPTKHEQFDGKRRFELDGGVKGKAKKLDFEIRPRSLVVCAPAG